MCGRGSDTRCFAGPTRAGTAARGDRNPDVNVAPAGTRLHVDVDVVPAGTRLRVDVAPVDVEVLWSCVRRWIDLRCPVKPVIVVLCSLGWMIRASRLRVEYLEA